MSNELNHPTEPAIYQIRIKGHLRPQWAGWFEDLAISLEDNGDTILTGPVVDQAALYGLLKKVRDLGIPLLSVNQIDQSISADPSVLNGLNLVKNPAV